MTELASCQQFSNQNPQHIERLISSSGARESPWWPPKIRQRARFRANESHASLVGGLAGGEAPVPWRTAAAASFPPGHVKRQSASSTCVRGVVEDVGAVAFPVAAVGVGRDRREGRHSPGGGWLGTRGGRYFKHRPPPVLYLPSVPDPKRDEKF